MASGASLINDVSGGLADPDILKVVADHEAPFVAMHWRAHSKTMQDRADYADVVADVRRELSERVDACLGAGIAAERLILGSLLAGPDGTVRPIDDREAATVALTTILAQRGVWGIRVHDVRASRDALQVVGRLRR